MKALQKKLEQREKAELIAIIQQMVRQEPYLEYLLTTPMPVPTAKQAVPDGSLYRQQVRTAMELGAQQRSHKEFERRLLAIKAIADDFTEQQQYEAALTVYEALVNQCIASYNSYPDEYIAFSIIFHTCIDGLDSCMAGEEADQKMRLRVLQTLFAIYSFYTDHSMDLDEDVPGLLVENATPEERKIIIGWVNAAITRHADRDWIDETSRRHYQTLLRALTRANTR